MTKVKKIIPFEKFSEWFNEAKNDTRIIEPTAVSLATIEENRPVNRMILLKHFDSRGFCFYTNFSGRKGQNLAKNNNAALCFYWGILGRQIRIEGKVCEVTKHEADSYFASRRRGSQIGAWASKQSQKLENSTEFESRIDKFTKKYEGKEVPRPEFWSGYRLNPQRIEFWQEGDFRLHDRKVYEKDGDGWVVKKLYP